MPEPTDVEAAAQAYRELQARKLIERYHAHNQKLKFDFRLMPDGRWIVMSTVSFANQDEALQWFDAGLQEYANLIREGIREDEQAQRT